jgi:DNA-binding transcriptional LysR family regulator
MMLQTQSVDLIIDSKPIASERSKIDVKYLASYEHCFFTTEKFFKQKALCIEDINNSPLIITSQSSDEIRLLKNAVGNIKINPIIEAGTTDSIIKLVKENNGIGYVQEEFIKEDIENEKLKKLNLSFTLPKLDIYVGYITENLAFAPKKFIEFIIEKA